MVKTINISIEQDALDKIDRAARKDNRSRSNFLTYCALEKAKQMEEDNNAS